MKAKITKIEKGANDDQIDVHVEYEDARFPCTHQHPDGGKRLQIFTCPEDKFKVLHKTVLEEMVMAGGSQLDQMFPAEVVVEKTKMDAKGVKDLETSLKEFEGSEFILN